MWNTLPKNNYETQTNPYEFIFFFFDNIGRPGKTFSDRLV